MEIDIRGGWNFFHSSDWCWLPVRMCLALHFKRKLLGTVSHIGDCAKAPLAG